VEDFLQNGIGGIIFIILLLIIIWFVTRELHCWYWKINKRVQTLESIDQRLADIQQLMVQGNTVNAVMTGEISNIASGINSKEAARQAANESEDLPDL